MKKTETKNQPQKEEPRLLYEYPDPFGSGDDKHAEVSEIFELLDISRIPYEHSFATDIKKPTIHTRPFYGGGIEGIDDITDILKQMLKDPGLAKKATLRKLHRGKPWFNIDVVLKELAGDDPRNFQLAKEDRKKNGWSHTKWAEEEAKGGEPGCAATHLLLAKNLSPQRKIEILSLAYENRAKETRERAEKYKRLDLTSSVESLTQSANIIDAWATVIRSYNLR